MSCTSGAIKYFSVEPQERKSIGFDMKFCGFNPPNTQALSDNVIWSVIPRTKNRHHILRAEIQDDTSKSGFTGEFLRGQVAGEQQQTNPTYTTRSDTSEHPIIFAPSKHHTTTSNTLESPSTTTKVLANRKRPSRFLSDLETAKQLISSIEATSFPVTEELTRAMVVDTLEKKIRHREYCRARQARNRKKEKKHLVDLQADISKLQCEIEVLKAKSEDTERLPIEITVWTLAADYSSYFNCYVSSPGALHAKASSFLHDIMAPDVMVGSDFGIAAHLKTWKLFAFYFADVHLELKGMDMAAPHTLVVRTIINVTITKYTLCRAFPHLNKDGSGGTKGGTWSPLVTRLIGQKLVMHGSALFGWNSATKNVSRINFHADMMTPVAKLLGNVPDAIYVFSKARVTPDCRFTRDDSI